MHDLSPARVEALGLLGGPMLVIKAEWIVKRVAKYVTAHVPGATVSCSREASPSSESLHVTLAFHAPSERFVEMDFAQCDYAEACDSSELRVYVYPWGTYNSIAEEHVPLYRARFKSYLRVAHCAIRHLTG